MPKNLLIAAAAGLVLLEVLVRFAGEAAPLIVAAPIALTFGWHIFSTLENKADKRRADTAGDIDDLVVSPLRAALAQLAGSKDDFDHTLKTMTDAPMINRLNQLNADIFRQFTVLVNVCGRIENSGRPEFGVGWSALADAAQDHVSSGFETLLSANPSGGPVFDEGAALVRRGLENLHTAAEQKIRELRTQSRGIEIGESDKKPDSCSFWVRFLGLGASAAGVLGVEQGRARRPTHEQGPPPCLKPPLPPPTPPSTPKS